MKKLLSFIIVLTMVFSLAVPALAAPTPPEVVIPGAPQGSASRIVDITSEQGGGFHSGKYIVHEGYGNAVNAPASIPNGSNTGGNLNVSGRNYDSVDGDPFFSGNNRYVDKNFAWDEATMRNYVFPYDELKAAGMQVHKDGFPLRATYRTPVDHLSEMRYLAQKYPEFIKLELLGYTMGVNDNLAASANYNAHDPDNKVPVYAIVFTTEERIGDPETGSFVSDGRPSTLHQAGNHAGELDANEYAMDLCWYLATSYAGDNQATAAEQEEVRNLIDTTRVYIIPYTNGDGNHVSFRTPAGNVRKNARGVDLNRNWAYRWGSQNGSSTVYGSSNHRGRGPNSESETQAITSVYRTTNVMSSISGHTTGQIVIFGWAFERNPANASGLIYELARSQTDINGFTAQNGNVMYAQSGEINDYLWGSMRALGFTYEYNITQNGPYMGYKMGDAAMTAHMPSPTGDPEWTFVAGNYRGPVKTITGPNYSSTTPRSITVPQEDVRGQVVFFDEEEFHMGYQNASAAGVPELAEGNASAGIGTNRLALPGNRMPTLEMLNAQIAKWPAGYLRGKIFMSHVALNNTEATAMARKLDEEGAVGWITVNTTASGTGGDYQQNGTNRNASYEFDGSNLLVTGMLKGYAANIHEAVTGKWVNVSDSSDFRKYPAEYPNLEITLKADPEDIWSVAATWPRQKPAFMVNMQIAREYANQIIGTVKDEDGADIDATLTGSIVIDGKVIDLMSNTVVNSANTPTVERSYDKQWKEAQRITYDINEDTTDNGVYTWFVLPSKQSEYDDKGWTITASAPGRYLNTRNVKFDVEAGGIPAYQQVRRGVDFVLPKAIDVTTDLEGLLTATGSQTVSFTTFDKDGSTADQPGVFVRVNGKSVTVESLGNGSYTATVDTNGLENISVGFAGAAPVTAGEFKQLETLAARAVAVADLEVSTNAEVGKMTPGYEFGVRTNFTKVIDTNVARLTYIYDPELFEYSKNDFENAGFIVLNMDDKKEGLITFTLSNADKSYGMMRFYPFSTYDETIPHRGGNVVDPFNNDPTSPDYATHWTGDRVNDQDVTFTYIDEEFPEVFFKVKDTAEFTSGIQTITVSADYVIEEDGNKVEKTTLPAMANFYTIPEPVDVWDLIFLSDMIDRFGIQRGDANWDDKYDVVADGRITILDISIVAQKIV